ncbi:MAG: PqqD family peptide modification chaperone [Victivallaceae bacterium]|nr:PqqD family peptide modification chaperone [Victivallaceae bacterium]
MKQNKLIVFRKDFDDTAVLFNPTNGEVMGLNRTGAFLWEKMTEGAETREALVEALRNACGGNVPPSVATDVDAFVESMKKHSFVVE